MIIDSFYFKHVSAIIPYEIRIAAGIAFHNNLITQL